MIKIMKEGYSSDARRMRVKGTVETLRIRFSMLYNDIPDVFTRVKKLVEHINILDPQWRRDFRSDTHKNDYLRKTVTVYREWSRIPIQSIKFYEYSFCMLVTSPHESVQQLRQIKLTTSENSTFHTHMAGNQPTVTAKMQHGRSPRPFRRQ